MIMASDVASYLIRVIAKYGDVPCVLEHVSSEDDGILLDPLGDCPVLTVFTPGSSHKESCVLFTRRHVEDTEDT